MSGCPSQHWRRPLTTAFRRVGGQKRTKPHGDQRPPVHRGRRWWEAACQPCRAAGAAGSGAALGGAARVFRAFAAPVPQMVDELVDVFKIIDRSPLVVAEQVIQVLKIIL